ncbi:FGFR1 oncogene partner 2 homolog [Amphibalanus amphitrite]|uniref:FGFR1 oncogene partner 2 homolog n=1 Tax=Amphibalanus amphitrite TaxID=1232801 RepID=UPI001C91C0B3|nr:FGFR1 oncogene partner 2 homolog [Amphibalanus amphitrite]XP_043195831.1 FGFR1 oncogene partner 2 homolog [Amphibalanus amphitrite]XP_043195832.1 FGFR1 oncogene partner 2 homolog [Amphibalanus amphitrite]XP_043195833.1 FGFR1 oncogene partner 2 homolog [Amphibalanus amphitrite]XP_043195834.1 FGFR1 oncogene partner 2 homolog [Amphibalanus amphitrite]XP_043195835.1 FGFR1 oncogene partner 2 homolog [Amphibalanus amphitrite]XP_043195837.1 FGFR1 oncogene partner 2 homolog [Amphibalanus amphitrit
MSLTMQNIISDAQTLCTQLKDHESLADHLISQAQCLYKQVDAMKQYEEEVGQLNEVAHQKPRDALVQGIQQENRHLRELQQENKELRNSLEEHQNTLEIVMSNYRKQVTQLLEINKSDRQLQLQQQRRGQAGAGTCQQSPDTALLQLQSDKIQEMALVMRRAVELDEQSEHRAQETIAQLNRENKGLRELLRVIYSYNSDRLPPPGHPSPQVSAPVDPDSPVSLPDSPCSQTARRPPSADSTSSGSDGHFQTVRRRPAAKGAADSPASPEGKTAPAPGVGSPGESKVPPVPTSAPPKVPALAARSPTTVKAAAVTVRPPAPSGPAPTPGAAPTHQGTAEQSLSPNKAAVPPPTKQSPEKQSSPQKAETSPTQQPASAAGSPQTATSPSPSE